MDIIALISNALGAVKEFFGFQSKKLDLKNTAEMKKGAVVQQEQALKDTANKAIANKDEDEIRKMLS